MKAKRTHCGKGHALSGDNLYVYPSGKRVCRTCANANSRAFVERDPERSKLFWIWCEMRARCNIEKHRQYKDYGGRGIQVCDRWAGSFDAFLDDMGPRPAGYLLERDNNDIGYSPENCRWATRTEQNSNRRNCIYVDCDGETVTLKEYCRRKNLKYRPIVKRIQDRHWPIEKALAIPVGSVWRAA